MASDTPRAAAWTVPGTFEQIRRLTRYQLREYLRSRRFVALAGIVIAIGAIVSVVFGHFRGQIANSGTVFYASFWGGGIAFIIVLAAVFFGGDAIAGEFQNKTGYFLMGLPLRRTTVYAGKFVAAFLASVAVLLVYLAILLGNAVVYFQLGAFPWELGVSLVLALVYLGAVLGATFLFSSLFKTSAYGFVLTAILFIIGFTIAQELVVGLLHTEPWFIISYANQVLSLVFVAPVHWGLTATVTHTTVFGGATVTTYTPGVAEGVVIMVGYLVGSALGGLGLFEREEFT